MDSKIRIKTKSVRFKTAPELYGLFFEDINHAADGGLYPEMIRNRAFEDSLYPEGCTVDEKEKIFITEYGWPGAFNHGEGIDEWEAAVPPTKIPGWYAEHAEMEIITKGTLNHNRKAALKTSFENNGKIYNIGYFGVPIKKDEEYEFYFMVKADADTEIQIALETDKGKVSARSYLNIIASEYNI